MGDSRADRALPRTADAVVVGAGVNGLSVAWQLAGAGVGRVVVLERRWPGAEASGKSGALLRTHYANQPEAQLAAMGLACFRQWNDRVGGDCGFQETGLLVFAGPDERAVAEQNVAHQRRAGQTAEVVDAAAALAIDPWLDLSDQPTIVYEPGAGTADPALTVASLVAATERAGARLFTGSEAVSLAVEAGRVAGVTVRGGESVAAPVVLVAAGALALPLLRSAGVALPVYPSHAEVCAFRWPPARPADPPITIDATNGSWSRPIFGSCTLVGVESSGARPAGGGRCEETVSGAYVRHCRRILERRVPGMRAAHFRGGWRGRLMQSADGHPIIGPIAGLDGLVVVTGDSGTSFKTSPAIGQLVMELVTTGAARSLDLTPFLPARFDGGRRWVDASAYRGERMAVAR